MTELEIPEQDEMAILKARAELMGISYHPSIGLEKLRNKLDTATNASSEEKPQNIKSKPIVVDEMIAEESPSAKRNRLSKEANVLIRIRLTCMNPAKKEWDGEIFTVGNAIVGSIKKYVPFNADDGWHVPSILLQMLRDKQCQVFTTERSKNGVSIRKGKLIKEFSIEVLPPLTQGELNELTRRQAMAAGIE